MTVHEAVLKELMIAGYEGASLLAAFARMCAAIAGGSAVAPVPMVKPANSVRSKPMAAHVPPAVLVTAPPKNAKAIATKAIAQSMLSPSTIALAARLIEHFNLETGRCDPGATSLADALGISIRQARRSVASLVASGLFSKARHGGRAFANAYQPNWPLMVERAAEGDIAAKRPILSAQTANVVTQNHLTKPDSDSMAVRPQRRRAASVVDRRQGYLPLPIAGGRDVSVDAVRSKLTNQVSEHLKQLEKPQYVEGMTRLVSIDWAPAITAEMGKAGQGLPIVLAAIASAADRKRATG